MPRLHPDRKHAPKRPLTPTERQAARASLKIAARGNPHREEQEELEQLELHDNIEQFEYVDGPHDDWIKEEMRREQEELEREMAWIELESTQLNRDFGSLGLDDEIWDGDPCIGCYDEDDSLML